LISAATYRLIQGVFTCRDLGRLTLKGISTPVPVYRVLGERGAQSRLDVGSTTGLTPSAGREREVGLLLGRWAQAKEGMGQVALLHGEAGIGESPLVQALKERLAREPSTRLECRCSAHHRHSPFYPAIDLYQRALQLRREAPPAAKPEEPERALAPPSLPPPDAVPLLASLLPVPFVDRDPALRLTPQQQKQKTREALLSVLRALTTRQPVLFILEDLHWTDPSTIAPLELRIARGPVARILPLLTCRPDFRQPWGFRAHLTPLTWRR
jgi:predicted ATPase